MMEHWDSTKAMTVYNALGKARTDLSVDEVCGFLARMAYEVPQEYVKQGVAFLLKKEWVQLDAGKIRVRNRYPDGRVRMLVRVCGDRDLNQLTIPDPTL